MLGRAPEGILGGTSLGTSELLDEPQREFLMKSQINPRKILLMNSLGNQEETPGVVMEEICGEIK